MKRFFSALLVLYAALLIVSCADDKFDIIDSRMSRVFECSITSDGSLYDIVEYVDLSVKVSSDSSKAYSFYITSPDGDLSWNGELRNEEGEESLLITPGASFQSGEYKIYIMADDGTEVGTSILLGNGVEGYSLPYFDDNYVFHSDISSSDINCRAYNSEDEQIYSDSMSDGKHLDVVANYAVISFRDRYGNKVCLRQFFN